MLHLLIVLSLFSSLHAVAGWSEKVHDLLPSTLKTLTIGKSSPVDAEKALGKAHLIEGHQYYWEKDGLKYALVLDFENKKLKSIHYTFTGVRPKIDLVKKDINKQELTPYQSKYFLIKEKSNELVFDPQSQTLYSVKLQ